MARPFISMTIALGPITRLFTVHMYFAIVCRRSWRDNIVVSEHLAQEIRFWLQHVDAFNGYAIRRKFSDTAVAYCEAGRSGFGGYFALSSSGLILVVGSGV